MPLQGKISWAATTWAWKWTLNQEPMLQLPEELSLKLKKYCHSFLFYKQATMMTTLT